MVHRGRPASIVHKRKSKSELDLQIRWKPRARGQRRLTEKDEAGIPRVGESIQEAGRGEVDDKHKRAAMRGLTSLI